MDSQIGSVSRLIDGLNAGRESSFDQLWTNYFQRLVHVARLKLGGISRRAADEEDVALSAFASFCRGVDAGQFPHLDDADGLWRLLITITARKAAHWVRDEHRQVRDVRRIVDSSSHKNQASGDTPIDMLIDQEPTPEFAVQFMEECELRLAQLADDDLRNIALLRLEGFSNDEIAQKLSCAPRTVKRRLQLIRTTWSQAVPQ